jgi:RimJ/RimL family protein N-acetyltransferase
MKPLEIHDEEICLRRAGVSEARLLQKAVHDSVPELERYLPWANWDYDLQAARDFLAFSREEERCGRGLHLSIFHLERMELIGGVGLMIRPTLMQAELGYWIRTGFSRQGYTTDASALLIDYGFQRLDLRRIYLTCDVKNRGSRRVAEKLGMRREGRLREYMEQEGQANDHFLYAILAREFRRR